MTEVQLLGLIGTVYMAPIMPRWFNGLFGSVFLLLSMALNMGWL